MALMGSTLCSLDRPNYRATPLNGTTWPFVQLLGLALVGPACGDDGGDGEAGTEAAETGDASTGDASTGDASTGGTDDPTGGAAGANFGLLNFTYYPATAAGLPEELGMAGAWRTTPFTTDDFYAVQAWSMHLPPAPAAPDTLENNAIPAPYEWGKADTWVTAGNAFKLRAGGQESAACLFLVGGTFPIYLSDDADNFDPACAPDPTRWTPGGVYDLIAFGGEMWPDDVLPAAITAPSALTVTSPDVSISLAPLDRTQDLALAWQADAPADRVVVRLIDTFGQMLSAHAADDGSFTIPAAELGKLAPGPATLTIARERLYDLALPAGALRVVVRYEVWSDPDLL